MRAAAERVIVSRTETADDVEYVELPMGWAGKAFGLATEVERRYVAGRSEVSNTTAAIRIVDASRQIFFVTCSDVEMTTKAG